MKSLVYYNLRLINNINVLAAIGFLILLSLMANMRFLTYTEAARIGETYVSIIGIIVFPYLCTIEFNQNIKESIFTKKTSFAKIIFIRIIYMMIFIIFCTSIITAIQILEGSNFKAIELIAGVSISTFFLGMIGLTASNIFENEILGYMIAFMYYFFELFDGGKHTKDLYLFSLVKGTFSYGKYCILLISLVLLSINLVVLYRKS